MANTHFFALAMLMVAGTLILSDYQVSAETQCGVNIPRFMYQCMEYVTGIGPIKPPPPGCCAEVKSIDFPCYCGYLPPDMQKYYNWDKFVYVGRTCGVKIQAGTKCGSYTVPPGLTI